MSAEYSGKRVSKQAEYKADVKEEEEAETGRVPTCYCGSHPSQSKSKG